MTSHLLALNHSLDGALKVASVYMKQLEQCGLTLTQTIFHSGASPVIDYKIVINLQNVFRDDTFLSLNIMNESSLSSPSKQSLKEDMRKNTIPSGTMVGQ